MLFEESKHQPVFKIPLYAVGPLKLSSKRKSFSGLFMFKLVFTYFKLRQRGSRLQAAQLLKRRAEFHVVNSE